MIDEDKVESELDRYVKKLKSIRERLEGLHGFDCQFTIKLNGRVQNGQVGYNRQDDEYSFKGVGEDKHGYYNGKYYSWQGTEFPEGKVSIIISFFII